MEIPLLRDIVIIFGLSIAVLFVCHRFQVPAIVGYLLTGVLAWPHGRTSLAILIFQDVIIVPMMLFTPLIAGVKGDLSQSLLILSAKGIAVILLVIISSKWIVQPLMYQIARTRFLQEMHPFV